MAPIADKTEEQEHRLRHDIWMASAVLLLALTLATLGFLVRQAPQTLRSSVEAQVNTGLGTTALLLGAVVICWWTISLLMALASALALNLGWTRTARQLGLCSPAFMRRLALAMAGISLLAASPAHATQVAPPHESSSGYSISAQETAQSTDPTSVRSASPTSQAGSAETTGTNESSGSTAGDLDPRWTPNRPDFDPSALGSGQVAEHRNNQDPRGGEVIVRDGDCLWDIVSRSLGPQASDVEVALEWPRWYEHNRAMIGENPDLLLPGMVVQAPPRP